jgi:hypothetical protein
MHEADRMSKILDAKYKKADLTEIESGEPNWARLRPFTTVNPE